MISEYLSKLIVCEGGVREVVVRAGRACKALVSDARAACGATVSSRAATGATRITRVAAENDGWRDQDSNLGRQCHAVYSRTPLTARESRQGR